MFVDWPRAGDKARYQELMDKVRSQDCVVFVGSGLSAPAGYPDWVQLVKELVRVAGLDGKYGIAEIEEGGERLLAITDECKRTLRPCRYYRFLYDNFRPDDKEPYRPIHEDLLTIPFNAYLTTNYDRCLLNAAKRVLGSQGRPYHIWPLLDPTHLRSGHIYFLHGIYKKLKSIRFTAKDYVQAYQNPSAIGDLLRDVYMYQTVVFIGFSMRDPAVMKVLETCKLTYQKLAEDATKVGCPVPPQRLHFALLPLKFNVELEKRQDIGSKNLVRDEDGERADDSQLEQYGIVTIRYRPDEIFHTKLTKIIEDLKQETAPRFPPSTSEIK